MPPSHEQAPDDATLVRYLLGTLSQAETERLDDLSVADDEVSLRLSSIEYDLVDAYVNGELAGEDLERFKSNLLWSAARRSKVSFAEALQRYQPATLAEAEKQRSFVAAWWAPHRGLAAAAMILLAAAVVLLVDDLRLRNDAAALRDAGVIAREHEKELQGQLNKERSAASAAQERARAAEATPPDERAGTQGGGTASALSFVLLPTTRDAGPLATLTVPRRAETVGLRLQLDADDSPGYRAVLKDGSTNRVVWRSGTLRAVSEGRKRLLSIVLRTSTLESKVYDVDVTGISANGVTDPVGTYAFRVVVE